MFLNKIKNFLVFSFFIFLLSTKVSSTEKIEGLPSVTDGDTIKINGNKIRLFGIDASIPNNLILFPFILIVSPSVTDGNPSIFSVELTFVESKKIKKLKTKKFFILFKNIVQKISNKN